MPISCGLLTCDCASTPHSLLPPWTVLNISAHSCPAVISEAFFEAAHRFHPLRNAGCRVLAQAELRAAWRARDAMLAVASWKIADACIDERRPAEPLRASDLAWGKSAREPLVKHIRRYLASRAKHGVSVAAQAVRKVLAPVSSAAAGMAAKFVGAASWLLRSRLVAAVVVIMISRALGRSAFRIL